MFVVSRRLPLAYIFLLCSLLRPPTCPLVHARLIFARSNASAIENEEKLAAKRILESELNDSISLVDTPTLNCTVFESNGTNVTCGDSTSNETTANATTDSRPRKRDRFKFFQIIIPILLKVAHIILAILKVLIHLAKSLIRLGIQALRFGLKITLRAAKYAIRAGRIVGRYVVRAGKFVLEHLDEIREAVEAVVDPVMDYYRQQEESKRLAAQEEQFLKDDMERQKQEWEAAESEVPPDVGEEPEWLPQRTLFYQEEEEPDAMPGWLLALIIITLVALIVAMPTMAFIIMNPRVRRRRRRRRQRKGRSKSKTRKAAARSKMAQGSKKSVSKKTQKSKSKKSVAKKS